MRTSPAPLPLASLLLTAALAGPMAGCTGGGGGGKNGPQTLRVETTTVTSNNRGIFRVDVDVKEGERFQVVFSEDSKAYLSLDTIVDPSGNTVLDWQDWLYSSYSITEAFYAAEFVSTVNWPIRAEDGPLAPGTYTVEGEATTVAGDPKSGAEVTATILYRSDDAPEQGAVHAIIAYCTGVRDDAEVVAGIEAGVEYWKQLFASWGVNLTVEYTDIEVDPALPDTYKGVTEYQDLLEKQNGYPLLMVVGDLIADDSYVYGEAGAIPGPMTASPISAVEVSWLAHAGANGRFSDWEISILGETMAHETGHYLGLFHPVEQDWNYWDALDDTSECGSMQSCESALGSNLMFPYAMCWSASECQHQDQLTDGQIGVLQRYAGVE